MTFIFGVLVGAGFAYSACLWLYQGMLRDERYWRESESRRNFRWPVRPHETTEDASS